MATPAEVNALVDEAFAIRVLDALANRPVPAVRHHDGVHIV
jgi:hypothetical protein